MKAPICYILTLCLVVLTITACQKDDPLIDEPTNVQTEAYSDVSPLLWDYFQRFEEEAAARGININLDSEHLTAEITEIDENNVAGSCTYTSHMPNHIIIDQGFWNQSNDLFREMVIFHELGHCVLYRGHREDAFGNGACASIMRSGVDGCFDNYRTATRDYYLDELFGLVN